jgi:predicted  nucleic acid-binding Zn-ribbon protein
LEGDLDMSIEKNIEDLAMSIDKNMEDLEEALKGMKDVFEALEPSLDEYLFDQLKNVVYKYVGNLQSDIYELMDKNTKLEEKINSLEEDGQ